MTRIKILHAIGFLVAAASTQAAAARPSPARAAPDRRVGSVSVGQFVASQTLRSIQSGVRSLGDTFDSELIIADSPSLTESDYLSIAAAGQSVPGDGAFHPAGTSQLTGFGIEASTTQTDNLDGTFTITVSTRVPQFSDGFLPFGLNFPGGGAPIDTIVWAVGPDADRDALPDDLDPLLDDVFLPSGDFDILAADAFLFDNGVQIGSVTLSSTPALDRQTLAFQLIIADAAGSGLDEIRVQYLLQDANAPTAMVMFTPDTCLDSDESILTVDINAVGLTDACVGGQFFLEYDSSVLDLVSIEPGDPPFVREIYEAVNEGAGLIDYAVGVVDGEAGTALPTTAARLVFSVTGDFCEAPAIVAFRPHSPPSRLTNASGQDLGAIEASLGAVTKDSLPPMLIPADDLSVNADAGGCSSVLDFVEEFDLAPLLCSSQTPSCWYTDRYAPSGFESISFDGDSRLRVRISSADSAANRPPAFSDAFYNTQGRKHDTDIPIGEVWSADLHIDAGWSTQVRRAGLWATTFDGLGSISGFPILSFVSNDPSDPDNPSPANPQPRFRVFTQDVDQNPGNGLTPGWIDLGLPPGFSYDRWWTLECRLTPSAYEFRVLDDSGSAVVSFDDMVTFASIRAGNLILQAYNFGESYDVYWDAVTLGPAGPIAIDDCSDVELTYERSDNPALTLSDPFPAGTTTITWTAVDECGNTATAPQLVTVDPVNTLRADLQLQGVDALSTTTRCITFEVYPTGGGAPVVVSDDVMFVDGLGVAVIDIPCGDYACIAARDHLHTLRSVDVDDFQIVGPVFVADFTASGALDDDSLRGGDLINDGVIDILDFGSFITGYGSSPGADTPCPGPLSHADLTADGEVSSADFTFIQIGFGNIDESPCSAPAAAAGTGVDRSEERRTPITSISVRTLEARGLGRLAAGDLNGDAVLDEADIVAFHNGAIPAFLADLDQDGLVSPLDVAIAVQFIRAARPECDINRDSSIDYADLLAVIEHLGSKTHTLAESLP